MHEINFEPINPTCENCQQRAGNLSYAVKLGEKIEDIEIQRAINLHLKALEATTIGIDALENYSPDYLFLQLAGHKISEFVIDAILVTKIILAKRAQQTALTRFDELNDNCC